jgi:predicted nucleic acid-binding protein
VSHPYLIDTNILLRISREDDRDFPLIARALDSLARDGSTFYYVHQTIAEYWNVATRPLKQNGFGLSIAEVNTAVATIEQGMILLPESEAVYRKWRQLVFTHEVSGSKVHDVRLVAAMSVHGLSHLLTLNTLDFARFPEIQAIHPRAI